MKLAVKFPHDRCALEREVYMRSMLQVVVPAEPCNKWLLLRVAIYLDPWGRM